jgi:flagellar hook-associated protein 1 FlgK
MAMNLAIENDLSLIASGQMAGGGDFGQNAGVGGNSATLRMAQLKQRKVLDNDSTDFDTYFLLFMADIGSQGYTANYMLSTQQSVCDQIQSQRDSVMGVSTDEEMLDIIKFQQGVGAMARYMTALDDMLDRVINAMGSL